jgi:Holliday junction resolvase RusA-like endonuclease
MGLIASFTVYGTPRPQGSTKTWTRRDPRTGEYKPAITHSNRDSLMQWRNDIRAAIQQRASQFREVLITGPVVVRGIFYLAKPPSVPKKRVWPIVAPDVEKLARAVSDALEHTLIVNDAQVVGWIAWKCYTDTRPKLVLEVWEPDAQDVQLSAGNPFSEALPFVHGP